MTAVPAVLLRPMSAEQAPAWATEQVRARLVPLSPVPQPARPDSKPGLVTKLPAGGSAVVVVVVGGGAVVVVVDGGGAVVVVVDGGGAVVVVVDGGGAVVVVVEVGRE